MLCRADPAVAKLPAPRRDGAIQIDGSVGELDWTVTNARVRGERERGRREICCRDKACRHAREALRVGHGQRHGEGAGSGEGVHRVLLDARLAVAEIPRPRQESEIRVSRRVGELHGLPHDGHTGRERERSDRRRAAVERGRIAVVVYPVADDFRLPGIDRRVAVVAVNVRAPPVAIGVRRLHRDAPLVGRRSAGGVVVGHLDADNTNAQRVERDRVREARAARHLHEIDQPSHRDRIAVGIGGHHRERLAVADGHAQRTIGGCYGGDHGRPVRLAQRHQRVVDADVAVVVSDLQADETTERRRERERWRGSGGVVKLPVTIQVPCKRGDRAVRIARRGPVEQDRRALAPAVGAAGVGQGPGARQVGRREQGDDDAVHVGHERGQGALEGGVGGQRVADGRLHCRLGETRERLCGD